MNHRSSAKQLLVIQQVIRFIQHGPYSTVLLPIWPEAQGCSGDKRLRSSELPCSKAAPKSNKVMVIGTKYEAGLLHTHIILSCCTVDHYLVHFGDVQVVVS